MLETAPRAVEAALKRANFSANVSARLREADRWFREQIYTLWIPYPLSWDEKGMRNKKVRILRAKYDELEIGIVGVAETNRYNAILSQEVNRIFPLYFNAKEVQPCKLQPKVATPDGGADAGAGASIDPTGRQSGGTLTREGSGR